ncbi:MAG: hypothetical protein HON65_03725 [Rhodospirillales bacterium]|nr:hypothetical protein [Rhodospirillales bacterium]
MQGNHKHGPGSASSFYEPGIHAYSDVDMKLDITPNANTTWDYVFDSKFRFAEDRKVDREGFSAEKMRFVAKNETQKITLGDIYAVASPYTMNRAIKGGGYEYTINDDSYVRAAMGSFHSNWEYVYGHGPNEGMDRTGASTRAQFGTSDYNIGLNAALVFDDEEDTDRGSSETAYRNQVGGMDFEYRNDTYRLEGEYAYAHATKLTTSDGAHGKVGNAARLRLRTEFFGIGTTVKLETVTPKFVTLGGGASIDKRRLDVRLRKSFNKEWQGFANFNMYHNKLPGSTVENRTHNLFEEVGVTRKNLFDRKRLRVSTSLRYKETVTNNNQKHLDSHRIKISASDRIAKIYTVRGSFELSDDNDQINDTRAQNYFYRFSLSSRHRVFDKKWTLKPTLSLEHQERDNVNTVGEDYVDGIRLGITARGPDKVRWGASFDYKNNRIMESRDWDTYKFRTYWETRPDFLEGAKFRIDGWHNRSEYDYANGQSSYREEVIKMGLTWDFKDIHYAFSDDE